jgi:hypothetical protein
VTGLTAADIAALKRADDVSMHYYDGRGCLRAHLRGGYAEEPRVFTAAQQRTFPLAGGSDRTRDIEADTDIAGYGDDDGLHWSASVGDAKPAAFHMIHDSDHSLTWQTIVKLLRPGDEITLRWRAGNNNGYLREAGLHADDLHLRVRRGDTAREMEFLIARSVCQDNSARMVKRYS